MYRLAFIFLLSFSAFGDSGSFRTLWTCPAENRGTMPERRNVDVSYNDRGEISFRPNIFSNSPFGFLKTIFKGRRSGAALSECVNGFFASLEAPLTVVRNNHCPDPENIFCQKTNDQIRQDIGQKIRRSSFYRKYDDDLAGAMASLGSDPAPTTPSSTPQTTPTTTVTPPIPNRTVSLPPTRPRVDSDEVAPPTRDITRTTNTEDPRARARLTDYLLDNYETFNEENFKSFRRNCPDLGNTTSANASFCSFYYRRYRRVLTNLGELMGAVKARDVNETEVLNAVSCLPPRDQFSDISDVLQSLDQARDCAPLEPGSFRRFPSGRTTHNYLLKRNGDGVYEASVVVNFQYLSGTMNAQQMQTRANNCFNMLAPALRTPSGEQLRVRYYSPAEADAELRPYERPTNINVTLNQGSTGPSSELRGNTATFTDNFGCETIMHETLHYLGLCDEYEERDHTPGSDGKNLADNYACRVIPRTNTIMGQHSDAISASVPLRFSCQCTDESCRQSLAANTPEAANIRSIMGQKSPYQVFKSAMGSCRAVAYQEMPNFPLRNPGERIVIHSETPGNIVFESRYLMSQTGRPLYSTRNVVRCHCTTPECERDLARGLEYVKNTSGNSLVSCPEHMRPLDPSRQPLRFIPGATPVDPTREQTRVEGDVLHIVKAPAGTPSLLAPNHMARIIYGNCSTGPAASYNTCQAFAYASLSSPVCSNKSSTQCSDDRYYLGIGGNP